VPVAGEMKKKKEKKEEKGNEKKSKHKSVVGWGEKRGIESGGDFKETIS